MAAEPTPVDLAPVMAKLTQSLRGQVPCERIEGLLRDLLAHRFSDARVTVYLPVFLYRHALEALVAEAGSAPVDRRPGGAATQDPVARPHGSSALQASDGPGAERSGRPTDRLRRAAG